MTSMSRSDEESGDSRVLIDADTPRELFAEMAMLATPPTEDPVNAARACARVASLTVVRWAEELEAVGYHNSLRHSRPT